MAATDQADLKLNAKRRSVDSTLTAAIKGFAFDELNADLAGIANIERFAKAPPAMSPQGIMPSARSVIVMAVHHPDACIELGGMTHPQQIGPYRIQYVMNKRLDEMSYRMAMFIEDLGFDAVPIAGSNIWRYKGYGALKENFAPDLSHRHAAVAAGLAEFGYSALAITPEYGARQRFITVITDAVLEPDPLLEPGSVCDNCMLCVKHCPSGALSKELRGWKVVEIEDKTYKYIGKNLWRCAWGEHFNLDLDLDIPEKVTEEVILGAIEKHGTRSGEFGCCLRYCVPKDLRWFDPEYTNAPRRKRNYVPAVDTVHRGMFERIRSMVVSRDLDFVVVNSKADLEKLGIKVTDYLPDGVSAVTLGVHCAAAAGPNPKKAAEARIEGKTPPDEPDGSLDPVPGIVHYLLASTAFDVARELERLGYSAVTEGGYPVTDLPEEKIRNAITGVPPGRRFFTKAVFTSAPLPATEHRVPFFQPRSTAAAELTARLKRAVHQAGAQLVGVSPAERLSALADPLSKVFDGEEVFIAKDRAGSFSKFDPDIHTEIRRVTSPEDHLPGAKSVIVIGVRLPRASVERLAKPPADAVGPYAFAQYQSANMLMMFAWRAVRMLQDRGFKAVGTFDLMGTGSWVRTPRGESADIFSNRFAAVAAGLGRIAKGGFVVTPGCGPNVRFIAIVTDAELETDEPLKTDAITRLCSGCDRCVSVCPTGAFAEEVSVDVDGVTETFRRVDRNRCDWAKRFSLVADAGTRYLGWKLDITAPREITQENLADALRQLPPIERHRPCNFENCLAACPYARSQEE